MKRGRGSAASGLLLEFRQSRFRLSNLGLIRRVGLGAYRNELPQRSNGLVPVAESLGEARLGAEASRREA